MDIDLIGLPLSPVDLKNTPLSDLELIKTGWQAAAVKAGLPELLLVAGQLLGTRCEQEIRYHLHGKAWVYQLSKNPTVALYILHKVGNYIPERFAYDIIWTVIVNIGNPGDVWRNRPNVLYAKLNGLSRESKVILDPDSVLFIPGKWLKTLDGIEQAIDNIQHADTNKSNLRKSAELEDLLLAGKDI